MPKKIPQPISESQPEATGFTPPPRRDSVGSTSSSMDRSPHRVTNRRDLLLSIGGLDDQLQLTLKDTEVAFNKVSSWQPTVDELLRGSEQKPGTMIFYRDHIDDLVEKQLHLEALFGGTQIRLGGLVESGEIKNGLLQPEKYTKTFMDSEIRQLGEKLIKLKMSLERVERVWKEKFGMWS